MGSLESVWFSLGPHKAFVDVRKNTKQRAGTTKQKGGGLLLPLLLRGKRLLRLARVAFSVARRCRVLVWVTQTLRDIHTARSFKMYCCDRTRVPSSPVIFGFVGGFRKSLLSPSLHFCYR